MITILGLGPGEAGLLTRQAWELLQAARVLYLRTAIHPTVAEATTRRLLALARERGVATRIVAGLSFVEPVCAALALDPLEHGLQLLDALDLIPSSELRVKSAEL